MARRSLLLSSPGLRSAKPIVEVSCMSSKQAIGRAELRFMNRFDEGGGKGPDRRYRVTSARPCEKWKTCYRWRARRCLRSQSRPLPAVPDRPRTHCASRNVEGPHRVPGIWADAPGSIRRVGAYCATSTSLSSRTHSRGNFVQVDKLPTPPGKRVNTMLDRSTTPPMGARGRPIA